MQEILRPFLQLILQEMFPRVPAEVPHEFLSPETLPGICPEVHLEYTQEFLQDNCFRNLSSNSSRSYNRNSCKHLSSIFFKNNSRRFSRSFFRCIAKTFSKLQEFRQEELGYSTKIFCSNISRKNTFRTVSKNCSKIPLGISPGQYLFFFSISPKNT